MTRDFPLQVRCTTAPFSHSLLTNMTKAIRRNKRQQDAIKSAFIAVQNGTSIRKAAVSCRLAKSTFHRLYQSRENRSISRKTGQTAFNVEEENKIVSFLSLYAARGYPLSDQDLLDAAEILISSFDEDRRTRLPFTSGRPGQKFARNFRRRHADKLRFGRATKEEAKRFASTNAENLTSFFAAIEKVVLENNIDDQRICNLDECGISAETDKVGRSRKKVYTLRSSRPQQKLPEFRNVDRITMMPVIFASGDYGKPLFVIKGNRIPYQTVKSSNGNEVVETLSDCLPRGSIITTRTETASVDKNNFLRWARQFVEDIRDLTANNRKVLLIYDAYRSHMHFQALKVLDEGGVIAFALPAHTSGTMQPLDVSVFAPWKSHIDKVLSSMCTPGTDNVFDVFDFCKIMKAAYCDAFTKENIQSGFQKTGLWPVNAAVVLGQDRPLSSDAPTQVATPEDMARMLEEKRAMLRTGAGIKPIVLKRGFIDTSAGINLTSEEAMAMAMRKEDDERRKYLAGERKKALADIKEARRVAAVRAERLEHERKSMEFRVAAYGDPFAFPRPMSVRRKVAAERTIVKKSMASESTCSLTSLEQRRAPWNQLSMDQYDYEVGI